MIDDRKQLRFESMKKLRPPKPTIRDEHVALRIAERIVKGINDDDDYCYWEPEEVPHLIDKMAAEIVSAGNPQNVTERLRKQQPLILGTHGGHPWGWEGIREACREIAGDIAAEELKSAVEKWESRYGK